MEIFRNFPSRPRTLLALLGALVLLGACIGARWETFPSLGEEHPRVLFFALDAVPYDLMVELTRRPQQREEPERATGPGTGGEPLFQGFGPPVPLISSFPATSSLAFTGILEPFELPKPPGYEAKFFDRAENRVRGGGLVSYHKIPFGWREFFTWRYDDPIKRGLASARPVKGAVREVEWVLAQFAASDEEVFHGYSALTDAVAHLEGPEGLIPALTALDRGIARLRRQNPRQEFHTVIYSDHGIAGGEPLDNVRKPVQDALEAAGFRLKGRIEGPDDAVMIPFGLVSSFEVYVPRGRGTEVVRTVAPVEGIDLCVARRTPEEAGGDEEIADAGAPGTEDGSEQWLVAGPEGQALILREERQRAGRGGIRPAAGDGKVRGGGEPGVSWSYRPLTGDPLDYRPVVESLAQRRAREGRAGEGGPREDVEPGRAWFPDAWWFHATRDHHFPDALHRLARTFDLVENQASAACSVAPGHMFGAWVTDVAARLSGGRLRWTHGALTRPSSLGFLMTDVPGYEAPEALRFDRAMVPFADMVPSVGEGDMPHHPTAATR